MSPVGILGKKIQYWFVRRATSIGHVKLYSNTATDLPRDDSLRVKPFEDIPGPKGLYNLPLIGPLFHFKPFTDKTILHVGRLYEEIVEKYGPIVKIQFGQPMILISDHKDAETVFRHEGKYPRRSPEILSKTYSERSNSKDTFSNLNGEDWYTLRSVLNKRLLKADSAHHYLEQQGIVADEFIDALANEKMDADAVSDLFFRYASESIGLVCFNDRLGYLDTQSARDPELAAFLEATRSLTLLITKAASGQSMAHTWYRNDTYRKFEKCCVLFSEGTKKRIDSCKKVLEARRAAGTLDTEEPNLLLSLLSCSEINVDDIIDMMITLFRGGTDSTAKSLQVLFYYLTKYPDKQEILREEILSVIGRDQAVTAEALAKMPYLKASLKESFRLQPPTVTASGRILPTDVVLSGYRIPAGPEKFIPERWLRSSEGRRVERIPKLASLPFGFGSRSCVGRRFAEQEIHLAAAKLLQKLKIEIEPESANTSFVHSLFVEPEKPIKFRFTKLDH